MGKGILAFILILSLFGCRRSWERRAEPLERIRVAYTVQPQCVLVHIAVAKGFFAQEGLEVESLMHPFGKASLQSLLEGRADFATVAETPVMFSILRGEKIFVITNIEASNMNNALVARRDAGIRRLGDLQGKRIAFTPGTTSEFFLDTQLTAAHLTRGSVRAMGMKPDEMESAILGGGVDAVCTWNYPLTRIKHRLGSNAIVLFDREIYTESYNVTAQQAFVKEHPETVRRFLRALLKAEQFVNGHTSEAQAIMATATGTDPDLVREVWTAFKYRLLLDQSLLITLEDETRWAMKNHLTDQTVMPDYRNYIHTASLEAVKPESMCFEW